MIHIIDQMKVTFKGTIGNWDFYGRSNEVIVYRVMMYANPFLIVQAMYSTFKGQSAYYCTPG